MPQLDFLLFNQNIGLLLVILGSLYLHVFMVFLPKSIYYLKLHGKLVEIFKSRITKKVRGSDIIFCIEVERLNTVFLVNRKMALRFYRDL